MNPSLIDLLWVGMTAALVFIMQAGFALLETGVTRTKNSINVAIKNLTDLGISILCFWALGFGLMYGLSESGILGTTNYLFHATAAWPGVFFLFQAMFCSTSATIVSGAVAERMRFSSYIITTAFMSVIIYPIIGHWIWGGAMEGKPSGWLGTAGFVDFAGSTVVHSVGGWVSLAALFVIGPRIGRYNPDGTANKVAASNIPSAVIGAMLLWFGWFGFNGGSTLAFNERVPQVLANTVLGGASGMIAALFLGWIFTRNPNVNFVINGSLAGLVAITANCHVVNEGQALIIGAVGGFLAIGFQSLLDKLRIDDAVGAIPVHLGAGIWGTLAVGLFGDLGQLGTGLDRWGQISIQLLGIGATGVYAFFTSFAFLLILNKISHIRVHENDEIRGLNVAEHQVSTEIYDLYQVLDQQAKTGDLSLRAPVEPFTEVGQIATQYNRVMDNLQENLVAKVEYTSILDNVHEGLFLINQKGIIGPYYSSVTEDILKKTELSGLVFFDLIKPLVNPSIADNLKDFLEVLFQKRLDIKSISRLNPLHKVELVFDPGDGTLESKHLSFGFRRIEEKGQVQRIMVTVRDLTQQVAAETSMEKARLDRESEMELFYKILHLDPTLLKEFLVHLEHNLETINRIMESGQHVPQEVLKQIFKLTHAIKGEALFLEMDFISQVAHDIEDMVRTLQKKEPLVNMDFLALTLKLSELQETGRRMFRLVGKLTGFQKTFLVKNQQNINPLVVSLEKLVTKVAQEKGKLVSLNWERFHANLIPAPILGPVKDILIQLIRNSVVHGIEDPNLRKDLGKDSVGMVEVEFQRSAEGFQLLVRDDGRGLGMELIREKALESGRFSRKQVDSWTKQDYVKFIFLDGISTSSDPDLHSGRGVGMSLVRDRIREIKARLGVSSTPNEGMEFRISIPWEQD